MENIDISFHIKYDTGINNFEYLDGYYGTESLLGISRVLLISLNAYLNREIITQAPSAKGFRIILGNSKKGSWEQNLNLLVTSPEVLAALADIGKNAVYDLLKWGFLSGVGIKYALQHRKSKKIIESLRKENDDLQEKLDDALMRAHAPVKQQGLSIAVRAGRTHLVTFDNTTLSYLETEIVEQEVIVADVCVSRFNARTGNGRFISALDSASFPFSPEKTLSTKRKTILADNLAQLARGNFSPIRVHVSRITSQDGRLKSYILHGIETK